MSSLQTIGGRLLRITPILSWKFQMAPQVNPLRTHGRPQVLSTSPKFLYPLCGKNTVVSDLVILTSDPPSLNCFIFHSQERLRRTSKRMKG